MPLDTNKYWNTVNTTCVYYLTASYTFRSQQTIIRLSIKNFTWDFTFCLLQFSVVGSTVGVATRCGLDGPGVESQWGRARFSGPFQTGPGTHPASCTMGTGSVSGRGVDLLPQSNAETKERMELYLCALMTCSMVNFTVMENDAFIGSLTNFSCHFLNKTGCSL